MKKSDVKIGMKVVPFRKTVPGYYSLDKSTEWGRYKDSQGFLYVTGFEPEEKCWILCGKEINFQMGDFFRASDFRPYVEKK